MSAFDRTPYQRTRSKKFAHLQYFSDSIQTD